MTVTRHTPGARHGLKEQLLDIMKQSPAPAAETAPVAAPEPATAAPEATTAVVAEPAKRAPMKIRSDLRARVRAMRPDSAESRAARHAIRVFEPAKLPPGVGTKDTKIAMDSALQGWARDSFQASWEASNPFQSAFIEGVTFMGFTYLAELTQRPEYRRISERIATEMTRKWIRITTAEAEDEEIEGELDDEDDIRNLIGADRSAASASELDENDGGEKDEEADSEDPDADGDRPEESAEQKKRSAELKLKVKAINEDLVAFGIREKMGKLAEHDGQYGRAHLYIDTGESKNPDELKTDLGDGSQETTGSKLEKGKLKGFKVIEPMWCYPLQYDARDPLADDWYQPQIWLTMQRQIHTSRLLCLVGREVADILKPAYAFAGLSLSQMAKPYVDNWLRTRQAVTNLVESFSVSGVYTNAQSLLQGGGDEVLDRIEIFNLTRANAGTMVLDKDTEEFFNVSTPLGTLDALQAQSQEQMSAVSGIPLVVLLGITPKGLNASSEGEIRVFYDFIHAHQEKFFRPTLTKIINLIQLNRWGEIDPEIGFEKGTSGGGSGESEGGGEEDDGSPGGSAQDELSGEITEIAPDVQEWRRRMASSHRRAPSDEWHHAQGAHERHGLAVRLDAGAGEGARHEARKEGRQVFRHADDRCREGGRQASRTRQESRQGGGEDRRACTGSKRPICREP
jgi:hypothetical protein